MAAIGRLVESPERLFLYFFKHIYIYIYLYCKFTESRCQLNQR